VERRQFFCDESGIGPGCEWFAIGMLSTTADSRRALRERVAAVRAELNFWNEVHFEKFSPLREHAYRRLLAETLPHVQYRALVARRSDVQLDRFGREWYIALNFLTKQLVTHYTRPQMDAVLYLDFKLRQERDNGLEYLLREVNMVQPGALRAVEAMDSKASELMQLSDLYLGLLRFGYEWGCPLSAGSDAVPAPETRKQRFYREFVEMAERSRKKSRFAVWPWQPPPK
jgi:hypothetical protein